MKRHFAIKAIALAVSATATAAWGQTQYTITDIAPSEPNSNLVGYNSSGSNTDEASQILYADSSGIVIGASSEYPKAAPYNSSTSHYSFVWEYNGTSTVTLGLTGAQYQKISTNNELNMGWAVSYNNSRIEQNGTVVGYNIRYDANSTSLGSDVWMYTPANGTVEVPLPSSVPVPAAYTANASNIAYSYSTATGTQEAMGGQSNTEMAGGNGSAIGTVTLYYNLGTAAAPNWNASGGTDAFYSYGGVTKTIGLVDGNNLRTTGFSTLTAPANNQLFARTNSIIRDNTKGQVLGTANYYGGATTSSNTGTDVWLYDPNNATGTGANGTTLIAPPATIPGDIYTGGGVSTGSSGPAYLTNSGYVAGTWQQFASTDTARTLVQSSDAYLYNSSAGTWSGPLGLTGSAYTYYPGTAAIKSGFGGSTIPNATLNNFTGTTEGGLTVGYTTRTNPGAAGTGATAGTDAWVYYPTGSAPVGATAGITQVGLTGGIYEANPGGTGITNNTRLTNVFAMTPGGAVVGASRHYLSATSTTAEGSDAWVYDPAHGITTSTMAGLTGTYHEATPSGGTAAYNYHNSAITAMNNNGLYGGYTSRLLSPTSTTTSGQDAWVFDATVINPATGTHIFNVDPNDTFASGSTFASQIAYISDSGVAVGYDSMVQASGGSNAAYYRLFEWSLIGTTPTFTYLDNQVVPTIPSSTSAWQELYNTASFAPSLTASGSLVGLGGLTADYNQNTGTNTDFNNAPFILTPIAVPEPTTLALLVPMVTLLGRRRRVRSETDRRAVTDDAGIAGLESHTVLPPSPDLITL